MSEFNVCSIWSFKKILEGSSCLNGPRKKLDNLFSVQNFQNICLQNATFCTNKLYEHFIIESYQRLFGLNMFLKKTYRYIFFCGMKFENTTVVLSLCFLFISAANVTPVRESNTELGGKKQKLNLELNYHNYLKNLFI